MVRNPVVGRVKTRLIPAIGADRAHAVYCRLLEHALNVAAQLGPANATVWVDSSPLVDDLRGALEQRGLDYAYQHDGDLGQRMRQALSHGLQTCERTLLIGSDCPGYSLSYLQSAAALLETNDVVLGPAADGGYVMIGARRSCPEVFDNMPWSSPRLIGATRERLRKAGLQWQETTPLHDIDSAADLSAFPAYREIARQIPLA